MDLTTLILSLTIGTTAITLEPTVEPDSVELAWDAADSTVAQRRLGYILYSTAGNDTVAIDTFWGGETIEAMALLPRRSQRLHLTAWGALSESGPSNSIYLGKPTIPLRIDTQD